MAWLTDPGNPNTGSFAVARIEDGGPLDPRAGLLGAAVYFERVEQANPDPGMAAAVAADRLRSLAGAAHTMTIKCVPQPWLEPGDVILVDYQGVRAPAQVVSWQMDAGAMTDMTVTLRGWRVTQDWQIPSGPPSFPDVGSEVIGSAPPVGGLP